MPLCLSLKILGLERVVRDAVEALRSGAIIIYPTDTLYGIGCDASNADAVDRVRALKLRPPEQAFVMLVSDMMMIERLADVSDRRIALGIAALAPAAVTFVLRATPLGMQWGARSDGTIAVRLPDNELCRALARALGKPLVSTSVNVHGGIPARSPADVPSEIAKGVDIIIDGGEGRNVPSTIVDCTTVPVRVVREGAVILERLRSGFGECHLTLA
jgi:tRNA threonylcarbamoyl adenosine modification protein (Sua5/YciO/YrdC/YwlC family)